MDWATILVSIGTALLTGAVSTAATIKAMQVHVDWLHKSVEAHTADDQRVHDKLDERIRALELNH